ncbi:hypothetical protein HY345_04590 [Candidatus Microgenomates bacterium]|nr:hypothetical protein [Candidatus Microgenomates bacterium]
MCIKECQAKQGLRCDSKIWWYWNANLRAERRFRSLNPVSGKKEPVPYMVNHSETVTEHIGQMLDFCDGLFSELPRLHDIFDKEFIKNLILLHEAEETVNGDMSWGEKLKRYGQHTIGSAENGETRKSKKEDIKYSLNALFDDDTSVEFWTDWVDDFDNWKHSGRPETLLVKFMDIYIGNRTVLRHGNDLDIYGDEQIVVVGERYGLVMDKLFASPLIQQFPEIFQYLQYRFVIPQIREYEQHGLKIHYHPRIYTYG